MGDAPPSGGIATRAVATLTCPSCGGPVRAAARFCGGCGAVLGRQCSACGALLRDGINFCGSCGASVIGGPAAHPTAPLAEAALGDRVRRGDVEAFGILYQAQAPRVYDFLIRLVRDPSAAEDLTQATFIRAFEQRRTLRESTKVQSWLWSIAHNLAMNHLSRSRRSEPIEEQVDLTDTGRGPEETAGARDAAELVWLAAASLEPRQYAVLDLTVRQEFSNQEVAETLRIPVSHAAVLAHRAREALGNAIRYLLVARRRDACPELAALVPAGVRALTPEQRSTVDHHMRRCASCRELGDRLTAPAELLGGLILVPIPPRLAKLDWSHLLTATRPHLWHRLTHRSARASQHAISLPHIATAVLVTAAVAGPVAGSAALPVTPGSLRTGPVAAAPLGSPVASTPLATVPSASSLPATSTPTSITSVQVVGSSGDYTVTVNGTGFGSAPVAMPFSGDLESFRIGNPTKQLESGYTGDALSLGYQSWTDSQIVVNRLTASAGDAIEIGVWNSGTGRAAAWGGNAPPAATGTPRISSVTFMASGSNNFSMIIHGTGFGAAPTTMPFVGDTGNLRIGDFATRYHGNGTSVSFRAGYSGEAIALEYQSWSDTRITISGFAGSYGGSAIVQPGDPVAIALWSTANNLATDWGGTLTPSATAPTASLPPATTTPTPTPTPSPALNARVSGTIPVGQGPGGIVFDPDNGLLYVAENSGAVAAVDPATGRTVATIPISGSVWRTAYDHARKLVYASMDFNSVIWVIDPSQNKLVKQIAVPGCVNTIGMAVDEATGYLYAPCNQSGSWAVVNPDTGSSALISTGGGPSNRGIGIDEAAGRVYAANLFAGTVSAIDVKTNTVIETIPANGARGTAFDPATGHLFVALGGTGGAPLSQLLVWDTRSGKQVAVVQVESWPQSPVVIPTHHLVAVANGKSASVSLIDTLTNTVVQTVSVGNDPEDITWDPSNDTLYVADEGSNALTAIALR